MTQYWHMQMHPDDQSFSEVLHSILENKKNYRFRKMGWRTG